jgi:hypothetical protein
VKEGEVSEIPNGDSKTKNAHGKWEDLEPKRNINNNKTGMYV